MIFYILAERQDILYRKKHSRLQAAPVEFDFCHLAPEGQQEHDGHGHDGVPRAVHELVVVLGLQEGVAHESQRHQQQSRRQAEDPVVFARVAPLRLSTVRHLRSSRLCANNHFTLFAPRFHVNMYDSLGMHSTGVKNASKNQHPI
jgi:hypothetical protein